MTKSRTTADTVPGWPLIRIVLRRDADSGDLELTVAGVPIDVPPGHDPRRVAILAAAEEAQHLGRPVRALASDGPHEWPLIVNPDATTSDPFVAARRPRRGAARPSWRMPADLGFGIAGLLILLGLATSLLVIHPAAKHTDIASAPPPVAGSAAPTPPTSDPAPVPPPAMSPPPARPSATPAPTNPTITFGPSAPPSAPPLEAPAKPKPPPPRARAREPTPTTQVRDTAGDERSSQKDTTPDQRAPQKPAAPTPDSGPRHIAVGRVSVPGGYCLDPMGSVVYAQSCSTDGGGTRWIYYDTDQLGLGGGCLDLAEGQLTLTSCSDSREQRWSRSATRQLMNQATGTCLVPARTDLDAVRLVESRCS